MSEYTDALNADAITACADLVGRAGARHFQIGYLHEDVPLEDAAWYAYAQYQGVRISADGRRSPSEAALALAERLLRGAMCRCGKKVALSGDKPGQCRWRLAGARWEPGCDVPPIHVEGTTGDLQAMQRAMEKARIRRPSHD